MMEGTPLFIECVKNNGSNYLRVTEVFRDESSVPYRSRRRVIRNIGPLSRFNDGEPDYLGRLRKSFKDGTPIIDGLAELYANKPVRRPVAITGSRSPTTFEFNPRFSGH
jgi:hypothetical protein